MHTSIMKDCVCMYVYTQWRGLKKINLLVHVRTLAMHDYHYCCMHFGIDYINVHVEDTELNHECIA